MRRTAGRDRPGAGSASLAIPGPVSRRPRRREAAARRDSSWAWSCLGPVRGPSWRSSRARGVSRSISPCRRTRPGIGPCSRPSLRGEKVRVPAELMLARIRRHGRMWGALVVRAAGASLHWDARQAFSAIGSVANELIDQIDRERIREVRARVDRKILEQSHPKHLAYELLHGIRSLDGLRSFRGPADPRCRVRGPGDRGRADRLAEGQGTERWAQAPAGHGPCASCSTGRSFAASTARAKAGPTGRVPTRRAWPSCWTMTRSRAGAAPRLRRGPSSVPRWPRVPGCWGS